MRRGGGGVCKAPAIEADGCVPETGCVRHRVPAEVHLKREREGGKGGSGLGFGFEGEGPNKD